ncbi:MAG: RNB domain-containing ribonuclease [Gammaproteobacteria bacterium]|nr:RNB domain-containing ribonuclease [Gammaproteobacteria bacterium]NIR82101.1 RNB domain-containing ribonuclease [Gammaproteobacteria bacterium]NIR89334.1 RNB domain-containing ribonuclease [Gammaproteobacteria bacterium]NIU03211.1 RNB domain-containing ribonuclease [Gammaproteobacteria bacterium]NIV74506.1 RNB domain-containing ribonuclease [Gammaproteobacteria bacterium]
MLYRSRPARVLKTSDKLEIELEDGSTRRVRPKDVALLHPGPVGNPRGLAAGETEVESAWELLAGSTTTLGELAELMYGEYTPESAWSAWQLVADGLYFSGTPERITACSAAEIAAERAARDARAAEAEAWAAFVKRLQHGELAPEDAGRLGEVEALARAQTTASRVLRALGQRETPEKAHALLLRVGHWDESVNPHPARVGVATRAPTLDLPPLPEERRVDLTHLAALAIDDEDNTDPDDAVSADGDRVWVHVADVAALVQPDSPADLEARGRGATLYLPERTVPMLPPAAVERLGLGLTERSPALSFAFTLKDGVICDIGVLGSWVHVTRLSYERAQSMLSERPLANLRPLAHEFRERRRARGAAFIELPEVKLRVQEAGEILIRPLPRLESRTLVTECMLMAGEAAARFAIENEIAFPFSTQPPPQVRAQPRDPAAMFAHRKGLRASEIKSAPEPHAGLGLELYAQVTSPLRRYLDLITHQQLRAKLCGGAALPGPDVLTRIGAAQAVTGAVRRAERLSNRHWTLAYLKRNPDWTGRGIVVERRGPRATLLLPDLGLEADVHATGEVALNAEIELRVGKVDLAALSARFRTVP